MSEVIEGGVTNLIAAFIEAAGGEVRIPRSDIEGMKNYSAIVADEEDGVLIFRLEK